MMETTVTKNPTKLGGQIERVVINREQAIKVFFRAIDHDDPYWTDLVEDYSHFDDNEPANDIWPSQWQVGRALGFTDAEMEKANGVEKGRLKLLNL
jgi:hypothetical protein